MASDSHHRGGAPTASGALQIRRVPIASLHLDPSNARSHPERNLAAITASLRRFGQAEPLVVQANTRRVIGGNGRLTAMRALGWEECDIVELEVDDLQATALGLALNRTGDLAEWNEQVLAQLLSTLRAEDALEGIGFDEAEIDELLAELKAGNGAAVDDQGPEPPAVNPRRAHGGPVAARRAPPVGWGFDAVRRHRARARR